MSILTRFNPITKEEKERAQQRRRTREAKRVPWRVFRNPQVKDSRGVTYETNVKGCIVRLSDRPVDAKRRIRKNLSRASKRAAVKMEK